MMRNDESGIGRVDEVRKELHMRNRPWSVGNLIHLRCHSKSDPYNATVGTVGNGTWYLEQLCANSTNLQSAFCLSTLLFLDL